MTDLPQTTEPCRTPDEMLGHLPVIEASPKDVGTLTMVVRRPKTERREVLDVGVLSLETGLVGDNWIRVGDAAMAVDPLSGNGLFQALSSSLQAPAVIRTLRRSPEQAPLAQAFHRRRITHLFQRFARIGRDFHASEQQWPEARFWQTRRAWPDAEPLHRPVTPADVDVARRPAVDRGQIVAADVVVTPDQPLGVWHLGGVSLAAALLAVRGHPRLGARQALIKRLDLPPARAAAVARWMAGQGWIADRGEGGA